MEKQNLFEEFQKHLMGDVKPSGFFNQWLEDAKFIEEYPYKMLTDLMKVDQSPQHHPEGNVWNHTMMVVDHAAGRKDQSEDARVFMWAALLHDLGKAPTTKVRKGRITSYDHDLVGARMAEDFLKEFTQESDFVKKVSRLVRWHMQILFVVKELAFADLEGMTTEVTVNEMALLSLCDRLGRGNLTQEKIQEECENIRIFLRKCEEYLNKKGLSYAVRPFEFKCQEENSTEDNDPNT